MKRPEAYADMTDDEVFSRIHAARGTLGDDLVILGHHYQADDVIQFADFRGDSLELSRVAADQKKAKYIVFCGVGFMAETAAMLCEPYQKVFLPAVNAPCPMALMANADDAVTAWKMVTDIWGEENTVPITYQNSNAALKAFCGRHGGAVCTSANAPAVFRWALDQGKRILFFPDEWLGTNTALALGLTPAEVGVWEPAAPAGGDPDIAAARVIVWKGYCHVHTHFSVEQIAAARQKYPDAEVLVHPECPAPVVQASDHSGSTSFILKHVVNAPAGSTFVVGTECHMVDRLAEENPDKTIVPLDRSYCDAMGRTTPAHLLRVLDGLLAGEMVGEVIVPPETARWANKALERMLEI